MSDSRLLPLLARATVLAVAMLLCACGAKEDVIEPSPLPDYTAAVTLDKAWSARIGKGADATGLRLEPGVTAQALYAVDQHGLLVARQRSDGKALWKVKTGYTVSAGPVAAYGQLIVGTREGEVVSFAADTGVEQWKTQLGGEVLAPPSLDADAVVVKATDGLVTLLDRQTGAVRWVYDAGATPLALRAASRPLLLADAVLVGMPSGVVVAIERGKGQLLWERRIADPEGKSELDRLVDLAGDFLIAGDRLYAASYQGKAVAMDLQSGQFAWQQPFSTHQSLADNDEAVFGVDVDSRIVSWRKSDGIVLWKQEKLLGRGLTGCAVSGNWLLVGDADGYLHVLRQDSGEIVGRRRIDRDGIAVTPVVDEGSVVVLGRSGKLAVLTLE